MLKRTFWNAENYPSFVTLDSVLLDLRNDDVSQGLLYDAPTLSDILSEGEGLTLDGIVVPNIRLKAKMLAMQRVMNGVAPEGQKVEEMIISDPFLRLGTSQIAVLFRLKDGQAITVYFHNPDTTPKKILPTDELISFKFLLNKKDVTIVVAPERGQEIDVRQVAVRIMRLAAKNSEAFLRQNKRSAERRENIERLTKERDAKKARLESLVKKINELEDFISRQAIDRELDKELKAKNNEAEQTNNKPTNDEPINTEPTNTVEQPSQEATNANEAKAQPPQEQPQPIEVKGNEFGEFDTSTAEGKKALREKAFNYLKELAERGETVYCRALNAEVGFDKAGAKKYKTLSADNRKLKLVERIKEIIAKGVKFRESRESYDANERAEGLKYHYIKAPIVIDGDDCAVRVVIREKEGRFFYDAQVRESVEEILDSVNENSGKPVSANQSDVSYRYSQAVKPLKHNIGEINDESQVFFDDVSEDKYVLNLFLFDENGNEIKDEEEIDEAVTAESDKEDKEQELLSLDKAFLNKVIRGEVDFMATDFGEIFIAVAERYDGKGGEMEQLVMKAANTYLMKLDEISA